MGRILAFSAIVGGAGWNCAWATGTETEEDKGCQAAGFLRRSMANGVGSHTLILGTQRSSLFTVAGEGVKIS